MKRTFFSLIAYLMVCLMLLGMCACSESGSGETVFQSTETTAADPVNAVSANESSQSDDTSYTVDTAPGTVTDTGGNLITSGSAAVSFSGTTQTISAAYLIDGVDVEITSGAYASASDSSDEVVFLVVNGGTLTIRGSDDVYVGITKTGSAASGGQVNDDYNFYGINSGIVVAGSGSSATIEHASIRTDANGSNAVVATADAAVSISDSVIATTGSAGSRGLHATYGGTISADGVSISTQGASSATLATDRGGGTINASNMTLETNSAGSPLVYSTGTINVSDSVGTANAAQMVVVEGGSRANVTRCDFACSGGGNRTGTSESDASSHVIDAGGIFIYQSFSGDAGNGTDYFTATDSTFTVTTEGVPMFYITNITADITLSGNTFRSASDSDYLFVAEETDQWGTTGRNGGNATVTLTGQSLENKKAFVGGSSSSLTVTATDDSSTAISQIAGTW